METILAHPENKEQVEVIKAFLKALKIKFESKNDFRLGEKSLDEVEIVKDETDMKILYTLTEEQEQRIEQARSSIKQGNFKSNEQIKNEVASWLHSL